VCSPALAAGGEGEDAVLVASVPFHAEQPLPGFADLLAADADGDGKLARSEVDGSELAEHFGWADGDRDGFIVAAEWELVSAGMSSKDYGCVGYVLGADGTPREKWRHKRGLPSIASPLVADGVVYLIKEGGMLTTLDAASGAELGFERLADAPGGFDASPVTADGKVYLASSEGRILVLSAGAKPEILARCDLGEEIDATPALGGGALFVRTDAALYCFARGE
jgi:outer membrane protein assembly factor BamB